LEAFDKQEQEQRKQRIGGGDGIDLDDELREDAFFAARLGD
jgi:hypothetical protein